MNIAVLGSGYVGLVTSAMFADLGHRVMGVDINAQRVALLSRGVCPIYEAGLTEVLRRNIADGRLSFTTDTDSSIAGCEIIFLAVGTPPAEDGSTDLSQVESAARAIAAAATGFRIVVNKSTVPVGTGAHVARILEEHARPGVSFEVMSNPEFLREGTALYDAMHPDRVVIGASSPEMAHTLVELYQPFSCPILVTDVASAEMIKYASNAFLAAKISYINAIANLCESLGADVRAVAKGMGFDKRIGDTFLNAGIGYGGSCFPKDVDSLIHVARTVGAPSPILEAVRQENECRVPRFLSRIAETLCDSMEGKTVALFGLTFKPNTDDLRESRSLDICRQLLAAGVCVRAHDPVAMDSVAVLFPDVIYCATPLEAANGADVVILATEWDVYGALDLTALRAVMRGDLLADGRNYFSPNAVEAAGLRYLNVGHRAISAAVG